MTAYQTPEDGFIKRAELIARVAHAGQRDKAGRKYIGHPRRVVDLLLLNKEVLEARTHLHRVDAPALAAAWLHDTVEDTHLTLANLKDLGMPLPVLETVQALTRSHGENLNDYMDRLRANPRALLVKWADLADNTDPNRLALLEPQVRETLEAKYRQFRLALDLSSPWEV